MTVPDEQEVLSWFEQLSNWGRWGADDELGTLNLITAEVRRCAAQTVTEGLTVSCAQEVAVPSPVLDRVMMVLPEAPGRRFGYSGEQITHLSVHGYAVTHLDALCHIFWDGRMYNGRPASLVSEEGAQALPITVAKHGIVTRGVLLDVAAVRGVPWLEPGEASSRRISKRPRPGRASESTRVTPSSCVPASAGSAARPVGPGPPNRASPSRGGTRPRCPGCERATSP